MAVSTAVLQREREWRCPGAESWGWEPSQPGSVALMECCPLVLSEDSRAWAVRVMGSDAAQGSPDTSVWRQVWSKWGNHTRSRPERRHTSAQVQGSYRSGTQEKAVLAVSALPNPQGSPKWTSRIWLSHKWWFASFDRRKSSGFRTGKQLGQKTLSAVFELPASDPISRTALLCSPVLWWEVVRELGMKSEVTWGVTWDHLLQWGMQRSKIIPLLTAKRWDLLSAC